MKFFANTIQIIHRFLNVLSCGIAISRSGCVKFFGNVFADLLSQLRQLLSLLLHQRMSGGLCGQLLQFAALCLFFFAEIADTLLHFIIPLTRQFIFEFAAFVCILLQLIFKLAQSFDELLIRLTQRFLADRFGVVCDANGPRPLPGNLRSRDRSFIGRFDL